MPVSLLPRSYVLRFPTFRIHEEELLHWSGLSGFLTWHARLLVQTRDPAVYRYRNGAVTEPQPAIFYGNDTAIRRAQALVDGKCARIIERGLWVKRRKDATLVERLRVSLDGRKNPLAERNPPVYYYSSRKYFFAVPSKVVEKGCFNISKLKRILHLPRDIFFDLFSSVIHR